MIFCIRRAPLVRERGTRPTARRGVAALFLLIPLCCGPLAACGKKGPPLAPLIRVPAASEAVSARRLGEMVYVQVAIPGRNQDNSTPADLVRVDVYGYTGTPSTDDDLLKYGTRVASITVRKPPAETDNPEKQEAAKRGPGFDQGAVVTVSETLTPVLVQPIVRPPASQVAASKKAVAETPAKPAGEAGIRVYAAVGFNHKGRRGAFSRRAAVSVAPVAAPPAHLEIKHTESQINLAWTPVQPVEADATPGAAEDASALRYNVYAARRAAPEGERSAAGAESPPAPLNEKPIDGTSFADPRLEFGTERCYVVRTVTTAGTAQAESGPSEVACVTPKDVFPPAAPKGLTAVTSAGAINLLWEPSTEPDLDGYLVLRGEAPGVTLQPITAQPIRETTFNDATVKAGVRYVYAIVAVDKSGNIGAQSNKVEETGR